MAASARLLAARILLDMETRGPTLAERLAGADLNALPARERAFLYELVHGVLRARGSLDAALSPLLSRSLARLDPPVRTVLRLGAHQILSLRVPDRAAVSESVDLLRATAPRSATRGGAGLVNAVLRRLAREGAAASADPERDPRGWLVSTGSLPEWLADRWLGALGPEVAVARARSFRQQRRRCDLRLNERRHPEAARGARAELALEPLTVPAGFATSDNAGAARLAERGIVFIQDQGSQIVAAVSAQGSRILDLCAAPGAKTTAMSDALIGRGEDRGAIIALEASTRRVATLARLVRLWGGENIHCVQADGRHPPLCGGFDSVLVDAPCSGLGTLGRNPDLRWRVTPEDLPRHALLQRELLEAAAAQVARGGLLVYSTCSLEREENEDIVEAFLAQHDAFVPGPVPAWADTFRDGRYLRVLPEEHGGDGFFVAVMRRP
jgi:16S rRNA (cytosine967-C5)-methyltransferase